MWFSRCHSILRNSAFKTFHGTWMSGESAVLNIRVITLFKKVETRPLIIKHEFKSGSCKDLLYLRFEKSLFPLPSWHVCIWNKQTTASDCLTSLKVTEKCSSALSWNLFTTLKRFSLKSSFPRLIGVRRMEAGSEIELNLKRCCRTEKFISLVPTASGCLINYLMWDIINNIS